ncbi:hypothetical protein PR202_gb17016 [Eleusine coracana subsp. coracana]|uniref:PRA1 family protein n=1 Tax=Eleusine coracana subsp. coracana TaxID=191504 RepID=A0AAV5F3D6_ELECO|nr:hypothetical protein PR202_gb17016 [Eleusine coracana subsp. coracana]
MVTFSLRALLLAHPFSLLVLLTILGTWCFLYVFRASDQPVMLFGHTFTNHEMLLVIASFLRKKKFVNDKISMIKIISDVTDKYNILDISVKFYQNFFPRSFLAFFLTSVASLIISGLIVGGAIVAAHGAFRMPEDLFLDDPSAASNGNTTNMLLSFLAMPRSGI